MSVTPDEIAAPPIALRRGEMVGDYVLEGLIGSGGMGSVYRGLQPIIGRPVAIKVLKPSFTGRPDAVARFVREARTIHRIKHRGVPDVFTFGTLPNGLHYYVMELLEGEDLRTRLRREWPLPPAMAVRIVKEIASILDVAHGAGIIHRDLKPENVFLAFEPSRPDDFQVKLLDFGIAKLAPDSPEVDGFTTANHAIVGTPVYMAPEQCLGRRIDHRSDIYGLGVLAYEMLAGRPPFPTNGDEVFLRKLSGELPMVSDARQDLKPFDGTVAKAMASNPAERWTTASEFAAALEAAVARLQIPALRGRRRIAAIAALAVLLLTGVAYAVVRTTPAPPVSPAPVTVTTEAVPATEPVAPGEPVRSADPVERAPPPPPKPKKKDLARPRPAAPPPAQPAEIVPDMPVRF